MGIPQACGLGWASFVELIRVVGFRAAIHISSPKIFSVNAAVVDENSSVDQCDAEGEEVEFGAEGPQDVVVPGELRVETDDGRCLLAKHRVNPLLVAENVTSQIKSSIFKGPQET